MINSSSFLYPLFKIISRNPWTLNLRHVFGVVNSISQDIGGFLRINLLAGGHVLLTPGADL